MKWNGNRECPDFLYPGVGMLFKEALKKKRARIIQDIKTRP